jgi:hypothetical protein
MKNVNDPEAPAQPETVQPDNRVRRVMISGREAFTPEGLAAFYAALMGRPVTDADVEEFRRLDAESAAKRGA